MCFSNCINVKTLQHVYTVKGRNKTFFIFFFTLHLSFLYIIFSFISLMHALTNLFINFPYHLFDILIFSHVFIFSNWRTFPWQDEWVGGCVRGNIKVSVTCWFLPALTPDSPHSLIVIYLLMAAGRLCFYICLCIYLSVCLSVCLFFSLSLALSLGVFALLYHSSV